MKSHTSKTMAQCLKITQNVSFDLFNFCRINIDLSGNTVWLQTSGFQKVAKMDHYWHFWWTFIHSKYKRSSLHSQYWMRLFWRFSNTVDLSNFWCRAYINIGIPVFLTRQWKKKRVASMASKNCSLNPIGSPVWAQCLKIAKKVSFSKTRQNGPFLALLITFCLSTM